MTNLFTGDTLDVPCPCCSRTKRLTVRVLEAGELGCCDHCGAELQYDREGLLDAIEDVIHAIHALKASIARLTQRL